MDDDYVDVLRGGSHRSRFAKGKGVTCIRMHRLSSCWPSVYVSWNTDEDTLQTKIQFNSLSVLVLKNFQVMTFLKVNKKRFWISASFSKYHSYWSFRRNKKFVNLL